MTLSTKPEVWVCDVLQCHQWRMKPGQGEGWGHAPKFCEGWSHGYGDIHADRQTHSSHYLVPLLGRKRNSHIRQSSSAVKLYWTNVIKIIKQSKNIQKYLSMKWVENLQFWGPLWLFGLLFSYLQVNPFPKILWKCVRNYISLSEGMKWRNTYPMLW